MKTLLQLYHVGFVFVYSNGDVFSINSCSFEKKNVVMLCLYFTINSHQNYSVSLPENSQVWL